MGAGSLVSIRYWPETLLFLRSMRRWFVKGMDGGGGGGSGRSRLTEGPAWGAEADEEAVGSVEGSGMPGVYGGGNW